MDIDADDWSIFPITDNLSGSYVDPSNLISHTPKDVKPIGMANFRSKRPLNPLNPFNQNIKPQDDQTAKARAQSRWKLAVMKAKLVNDPWSEFHIENYPAERAVRHRYNAIKKVWLKDECIVKMETKQFANGAMRACYRLKKLSNFSHKPTWESASNYVAKCYMDPEIPRERYFDECKLQMDAKLWAETYNRHNPAKKVDMFQVTILEFTQRPNSPLYHLEHYIEGKYIKYNSNSGYVDECMRNTPQAFSHFTFECSNHELIVVDIQGVGDLYTDPQVHTANGTEYGDGNLGTKGMALFFHSHVCNEICRSLGLTPFDLASNELKSFENIKTLMKNCSSLTVSRGSEELCVGSPTSYGEYFKQHSFMRSQNSIGSDENNISDLHDLHDIDESEGYESSSPAPLSPSMIKHHGISNAMPIPIAASSMTNARRPRVRTESSCLDSAFSPDDAVMYFNMRNAHLPRPSCVQMERAAMNNKGDHRSESLLGQVHLDLCKYHEMGRFVSEDQEFDANAAFFHLEQAAKLGIVEAILNVAKIYLDLPRDILPSFKVPENENNMSIGFDYMCQAAEKGDKTSMLHVARAYDTGNGLDQNHKVNWQQAIVWYNKIVNSGDEEKSVEDAGYSDQTDEPAYLILARIAEMYQTGGNGIEKNLGDARDLYNEAAEKAMACAKGRIANKYYMLAETISAEID